MGGRQGTNGLCVVTKTNAWRTVRCESAERRRGGDCLTIFGGSSTEIDGRMEGMRCVLKVSELNHSVKERAFQESLRGKYEVWRGGEVESVEKEWEKFRDSNGVYQ